MERPVTRALPAWRFVALGLVVSAAGAFGIVNMASAQGHPEGGPKPRHHQAMRMPGLPLLAPGPMLDRLLDGIQATDAQRTQLRQIAEGARADLRAGQQQRRADQSRLAELFAQPVVDEAAVEALRRKMLARHDQASQRTQAAMLQVAKVLSAEQRQQLVAQMQQQREHARARPARRGETPADTGQHTGT